MEVFSFHCFEDLNITGCFSCTKKDKQDKKRKNFYVPIIRDNKYIVAQKTKEMKKRDILIRHDEVNKLNIIVMTPDYILTKRHGDLIHYFVGDTEEGQNLMEFWSKFHFYEMTAIVESIENRKYPQLVVKIITINLNMRIYGSYSTNMHNEIDNIVMVIEEEELNQQEIAEYIVT